MFPREGGPPAKGATASDTSSSRKSKCSSSERGVSGLEDHFGGTPLARGICEATMMIKTKNTSLTGGVFSFESLTRLDPLVKPEDDAR
jgi:hypothetical protein